MTNAASSVLTPGVTLSVNLTGGVASPGTNTFRCLLIGGKSSAGSAAFIVGTTLSLAVANAAAVSALYGPGTPAHLFAKAAFAEHPSLVLDCIASAEASGNAATQTIVFDDDTGASTAVTVAQLITLEICGRPITYTWAAGVGKVAAATGLVAEIAKYDADIPVTAANAGGTVATVTLTFKMKGTLGNDVVLALSVTNGTGGSVTLTGTAMASGTTEPLPATALATVAGIRYKLIASVLGGNTDTATGSASSIPGKIATHIATYNTGFSARLQQAIFGITGAIGAAKTGTAALNSGVTEYIFCRSGRSLPAEWAGAELGARVREAEKDPAVNRSNRLDMPYKATLYGPKDLTTGALTDAEMEDGLQSGLAAVKYTSTGVPLVAIPRTTYWKDGSGTPDHRLVHVSQPDSLYVIAEDIQTFLPQRFPGCKIVPALPPGDDETPPNVVDAPTVKSALVARMVDWCRRGVARRDKLDAAVADGTFSVAVDSGNASKLNIVIPASIVPPLEIFDTTILGS